MRPACNLEIRFKKLETGDVGILLSYL